jgi:SAM-dependent methyltransferase
MQHEEVRRQFDCAADGYATEGSFHARYASRLVELTPLAPSQRVLDACCGTGVAAFAAVERVGDTGFVVGVDTSERMIEEAQRGRAERKLANVEFRVGDAADPTLLGVGQFAAIVCSSSIIYLPLPEVLHSWRDALLPSGVVAFSTIAADGLRPAVVLREAAASVGIGLPDPNEVVGTADRCRALLSAAGFGSIQVDAENISPDESSPNDLWERSANAAAFTDVSKLPVSRRAELRRRYLDTLRDSDIQEPIRVLYAVGRTP